MTSKKLPVILILLLALSAPQVFWSQPSPPPVLQKRVAKSAKKQRPKAKTAESKEAEWSPLTECQSEQAQTTDTPTFRVGANSKGVAAASTRVYKDGLIIPDDKDLHSPEVTGLREQLLQDREKSRARVDQDLNQYSRMRARHSRGWEWWRNPKVLHAYQQYQGLQDTSRWSQLPTFDWRERGLDVGQVMNQGKCGSCWAFVAIAVYLSSWNLERMRLGEKVSELVVPEYEYFSRMPSVQQMLNCISKSKGDCTSGWHGTAFDFMVTSHVPHIPDRLVYKKGNQASIEEYTARKSPCTTIFRAGEVARGGNTRVPLDVSGGPTLLPRKSDRMQTAFDRALAWGYVNDKDPNQMPSPEQLKAALVEHGPLAVAINADNCFTVYKGGVFNGHNKYSPNHVLMLIGWDDSKADNKGAWLIKNSWGVEWGEAGFGWVEYGSNSIGRFAAWIQPSPSTRER